MRHLPSSLLLAVLLAGNTQAGDILVDASGVQSAHTTVASAMAVAAPGDRLLVLPGTYPPFLFDVGVQLLGMGAAPGDVLLERVDMHVGEPVLDYDVTISNVTVGNTAPANAIALSGNEQGPGVVVLDGVVVIGGVFLGGGADGFHLLMNDSSVRPPGGHGFAGAAMHLGGSAGFSFEIVDSIIEGWDADDGAGLSASSGLQLAGALRGRVVRSVIRGGRGSPAFPVGGAAVRRFGSPADVRLRVDGGSDVVGGDAGSDAPGGDGIDLRGVLELGAANVAGGAGLPDGLDVATDLQVALIPLNVHLAAAPALLHADAVTYQQTGDALTLQISGSPSAAAILVSLDLDLPAASPAPLVTLGTPTLLVRLGHTLSLVVPDVGYDLPGVMIYAMGWVRPEPGAPLMSTNVVARRVDFVSSAQP